MKKFIVLAATLFALSACKKDPFENASVLTLDATGVGRMGVTLNGFFKPDKAEYNVAPAFLLSTKSNKLTIEDAMDGETGFVLDDYFTIENNRSSATITGMLEPGTTYYYRALNYYYSEAMDPEVVYVLADNICSFTTLPMKLELVTEDAANIGPFSATLCGSLDTDADAGTQLEACFLFGGENATLESLKEEGTRLDTTLPEPGQDGKRRFTADKDGLAFLTTYSYVACVQVGENRYYGELKQFTTPDYAITLTTEDAEPAATRAILKASLSESLQGSTDPELWFLLGPAGASLEQLKADGTRVTGTLGEDFTSFQARTPLLGLTTSYSYAAFASVSGKDVSGAVKTFTTVPREVPEGTVEMGLTVLWADRNLGADSPEGAGGYYCWGETEPKEKYEITTYKWSNGAHSGENGYTKYNDNTMYGPVVDNKFKLDPEDDAALVNLGAPWRLPTAEELRELRDYCDWEKVQKTPYAWGHTVTSRITGNSIYLPNLGSRSGTNTVDNYGTGMFFCSEKMGGWSCISLFFTSGDPKVDGTWRHLGYQVRPVRE